MSGINIYIIGMDAYSESHPSDCIGIDIYVKSRGSYIHEILADGIAVRIYTMGIKANGCSLYPYGAVILPYCGGIDAYSYI